VIAEPDVALTDLALALEAAVLAAIAGRSEPGPWVAFFASISAAALLGGITHGFFPEAQGPAGTALWRATLLAVGVTSASAIVAGGQTLGTVRLARCVRRGVLAAFVVYAGVVLFLSDAYAVALVSYLPATLFLLAVFVTAERQGRSRHALAGAIGIGVLLAGSWVQWHGISLPALGLGHNALYHVIAMVALLLIYVGMRGLRAPGRSRCCLDGGS
jgi:hypothetical protein